MDLSFHSCKLAETPHRSTSTGEKRRIDASLQCDTEDRSQEAGTSRLRDENVAHERAAERHRQTACEDLYMCMPACSSGGKGSGFKILFLVLFFFVNGTEPPIRSACCDFSNLTASSSFFLSFTIHRSPSPLSCSPLCEHGKREMRGFGKVTPHEYALKSQYG